MTGEFIPYGRQSIDEDDIAAVVEVLRSDWLTTGPVVSEFEGALSETCGGVPCVAVSSGTAALHCAYAAAGVGPGDEVITTPLTFAATATTAIHLGATIKFADVDDGTLNVNPDGVRALVTSRTRAITAVDFAGQPAKLSDLREIADDAEAVLVEDAAHSLGARYQGSPIGSIADFTTFSFHPVKTITTGEGGAVTTLREENAEAARRFRNHGLVREKDAQRCPSEGGWHQEVQRIGLNYRLSDVLAAIGISQLRKLRLFKQRRAELVHRYRTAFAQTDGLRLLEVAEDVDPAWHLFPVRVLGGRRNQVYEALHDAGIGTQVHYLPVHCHPALQEMGYRQGMAPIAEYAYKELLSLPLYPTLTEGQQDRCIEALQDALHN